jgi:hypothetical protein
MYLYMYRCVYICVHVCIYIHMDIWMRMYIYLYIYICSYVGYIHIYMVVNIYICTCTCIYIHIYVYARRRQYIARWLNYRVDNPVIQVQFRQSQIFKSRPAVLCKQVFRQWCWYRVGAFRLNFHSHIVPKSSAWSSTSIMHKSCWSQIHEQIYIVLLYVQQQKSYHQWDETQWEVVIERVGLNCILWGFIFWNTGRNYCWWI